MNKQIADASKKLDKIVTDKIKRDINNLFEYLLNNAGEYRDYTDEELKSVTFIFTEVLLAKTFDKHKDKVTQKGMQELAKELGGSIHQTIKVFTGVDLKEVL